MQLQFLLKIFYLAYFQLEQKCISATSGVPNQCNVCFVGTKLAVNHGDKSRSPIYNHGTTTLIQILANDLAKIGHKHVHHSKSQFVDKQKIIADVSKQINHRNLICSVTSMLKVQPLPKHVSKKSIIFVPSTLQNCVRVSG